MGGKGGRERAKEKMRVRRVGRECKRLRPQEEITVLLKRVRERQGDKREEEAYRINRERERKRERHELSC